MKKSAFKILLVAVVAMYATACTKEDTSGSNSGGGTTGGSDVFVWTENDNTFAAANIIKCDSAYASAQYKSIFVYKGATATKYFFEINLSSIAVANYSIGSTNAVAYVRPGSQIISGTAGNIEITANAGGKISGTGTISMPFNTATNPTGSIVYVRFTNLQVR